MVLWFRYSFSPCGSVAAFTAEKLRKQPRSHVAAVAKADWAILVIPPQTPAQWPQGFLHHTPLARETNPSFSKPSKYIHSWGQQSPGLTKALLLLPQEGNVTNPTWILGVNGHQEIFRHTEVGATAIVPHTTSLQIPPFFLLFYTVRMKKSTSLSISDTIFSSAITLTTVVSSGTHNFFSSYHSWDASLSRF